MTWEAALTSAIQVAIAIAGFSGIVAAVGRRAAGEWTSSDQMRLQILLTASGSTIGFSFLPFILLEVMSADLVWRVCSALHVVYTVGIVVYRFRQASATNATRALDLKAWRFVLQAAVLLGLLANAVWFAIPALYVLAIVWGLLVAFMAFVVLLLESLRDPSESS